MQRPDLPATCNQDGQRIHRRGKRSRGREGFYPEWLLARRRFAADASGSTEQVAWHPMILAFSFGASFFTPCVFPTIPPTASFLASDKNPID